MVPAMNPTLYCNKCGAPNSVEAQFCSRCGGALNPVPAARSPAEAVAAAPVVAGPYTSVSAAAVGYGGFWIRVVAFIIDAIIVRAVAWPVSMILGLGGLAGIAGGFRECACASATSWSGSLSASKDCTTCWPERWCGGTGRNAGAVVGD